MARDVKLLTWITEAGWEAARALLDDAEERLTGGLATAADRVAAASRGEPFLKVRKLAASEPAETVVLRAAEDADVLVLTRDSRHPGPHSIGHAVRFIADHAPCTVVLAWPADGPDGPVSKPMPKPKPKPH